MYFPIEYQKVKKNAHQKWGVLYLLSMKRRLIITEQDRKDILAQYWDEVESRDGSESNEIDIDLVNSEIQKIQDELTKKRDEFSLSIKPLVDRLEDLSQKRKNHYITNLENISVVEWKNPAGISYLKGTFYIYDPELGKVRTASTHIGKLEDFPLGKNDPRARQLGIQKAEKYAKERGLTFRKG